MFAAELVAAVAGWAAQEEERRRGRGWYYRVRMVQEDGSIIKQGVRTRGG